MSDKTYPFQPGAMLHDAIVASFRANNASFENWLAERGIASATARGATYGQSRGPKGTALLQALIEAADPEMVRALYLRRLGQHMADLQRRGVA
jgi:hypothetical protein